MLLRSFSVENYRAFMAPTTLELRPLTLLFGYNNAGKSALLRWLPLLADSATGKYPGLLALNSEPARNAAFEDLCSRQSENPILRFSLQGTLPGGDTVECAYSLQDMPRLRHFLTDLSISHGSAGLGPAEATHLTATWTRSQEPGRDMSQEFELDYRHARDAPRHTRALVRFRGLSPTVRPRGLTEGIRDVFNLQVTFLQQLEDQVQWIGAIRHPPRRRVEKLRGGSPPRKIASDGSGAAELLAFDQEQGSELIHRIEAWFRGDGDLPEHRFTVQPIEDHVRLKISPWRNPRVEVDLIDAGEGMTQVLPVLVALARADRGEPEDPRIIVVEQPELHLHPRKEAALARFLARLVQKDDPPTILLETHSEMFLLALQVEVAEGRLDPGNVGVHWIRQLDDGSSIAEPVPIDEYGRLQGWPRGVFEEDSDLARQLIEARMGKAER